MRRGTVRDERWAGLFEECRPALYRAAALMVGAAEAEEVVRDAFERAMRDPAFFERVHEPIAWLRTVTAHRALGAYSDDRSADRAVRPADPATGGGVQRAAHALTITDAEH